MIAASLVLLYAAALAWSAPALLTRLTGPGASTLAGLAAWLTAMLITLASAMLALALLLRAVVAGWSGFARAVCTSVAGGACTPVVYRSALFEFVLALFTAGLTLAATALAWRYGRGIQRARRATRVHAAGARLAGRPLTASGPAVVLDASETVAYCLPGSPGMIVLTTGALTILEPAQLSAVLAHERAHLSGHHHLLLLVTRGLAAVLPGPPVFTTGPDQVARLAEMRADDKALGQVGRQPLASALLAMGTGSPVPARALAATGCATLARVQRLLDPPCPAQVARCRLCLLSLCAALVLGWGLVTALALAS